ncbi:hypothetical protein [Caenimonas aquaedulcis]|uniref:DUF2268 domain-containing protein n=1 Tax=Caenimonas aquaedulcis TaxID=2793270 RepID=A0A931H0X5_9BURK|nr:hypothetical protein [Caenimonas aquaedulcis]MBG9386533.1 hypothetical protein [Caenimonas aquaedulcis]
MTSLLTRRGFLFAAAALAVSPALAAEPAYRVINLMPDYWAFFDQAMAQGLNDAGQAALFEKMVIARHPAVYTPRVLSIDESKPFSEQVATRYARIRAMNSGQTELMRRLSDSIGKDMRRYETRFREVFPDLAYDGDIYFLYSLGAFDGVVRPVNGKPALLFGIDMIAFVYGTDADPQPFFHHELFHLYHRQSRGMGRGAGGKLVSPLWAEGLAVYVARTLNPQAGEVSIFGLPRGMPERAHGLAPQLARDILGRLDSTSRVDYERFFVAGRTRIPDVPVRSGYFIGYLVAAKLAKKYPLLELAHMRLPDLRPEIEAALREIAAGSR